MNEGIFPGGSGPAFSALIDPIASTAQDAAASAGPVRIGLAPEAARFSLRISPQAVAAADEAFALALPRRIGARAQSGGRSALMLGPDEWALRAPMVEAEAIEAAFAALAAPHSLVEVSAREVAIMLEGARAAELLTIACPRDLRRFAVGEGRRTIFDSVAIVLEREAEDAFRIEVWRSFAPHVLRFLSTGNREFGIGL
ncbi:MAG: sarcosine oxidase subunit gamma family protein [Pseudomonadota bacterium]